MNAKVGSRFDNFLKPNKSLKQFLRTPQYKRSF
jgi:hypothetical protein